MVVIEQGGIAKATFDVVNGTIDSITKMRYFSCSLLVSSVEMAEEEWHITHHFKNHDGEI